MKRFASFLIIIFIILSFSGCGGSMPASNDSGGAAPQSTTAPGSSKSTVMYSTSSAYSNTNTVTYDEAARKVIYNASVKLDVKDLSGTSDSITSKAKEMGGYTASSSIHDKVSIITVRVPASKLDEFLKFVDTLGGQNKEASMNTDDITDQYTDTESRVRNLKAEETQLLEIMKKAVTIDETLKVQSELYRVRGEIESLEGKINMWNKLVEMSTVSITLNKIEEIGGKDVGITFISWDEISKGISNGFNATLSFLIRFFSSLFIIIVGSIPLLPFIGVGIWLLVRYIKKSKRKAGKQ